MNKLVLIICVSFAMIFLSAEDIKMALQPGKSVDIGNLYPSGDGGIIAGVADYNKVIFFDKYGAIINTYVDSDNNSVCAAISISPDNKRAIIPYTVHNIIFEINTGRFKIVNKYADTYHRHTGAVGFLDDKTYIAAFASNISIPVMISKSQFENQILNKIGSSSERNSIKNIYTESPDDPDYMVLRSDFKYNWDLESIIENTGYKTGYEKYMAVDKFDIEGNYLETIYVHKLVTGDNSQGIIFNSDRSKMIIHTMMRNLILIDINSGKLSEIAITENAILNWNHIRFMNKDKNVYVFSPYNSIYYVYNLDGLLLQSNKITGFFLGYDTGDSRIITAEYRYNMDKKENEVFMLYLDFSGKKMFEKKIDVMPLMNTYYSERNKLLYYSSNRIITLYSTVTNRSATITMDLNDWLIYTDEGYWEGSRNAGKFISMVRGLNAYGIDQLAVKYNRPDLVYSSLGSNDTERLAHYKALYDKRLKKLGLTEKDLAALSEPPEIKITDSAVKGDKASLKFSLIQTTNKIVSYNIYVNDVPVYGSAGAQVTAALSGDTYYMSSDIDLISGDNKIEVSCTDVKGIEGYRAVTKLRLNAGRVEGYKAPDLYYIGFGVSKYKDPGLNLKYADKDASDLKTVFDKMKKNYGNVYSYIFTNEAVTRENIIKAKTLLSGAKANDTLVLFIAGHGVHDDSPEAKYYYLTYNTDLNNLSGTAADFELIEDILQGIKPRHKLFLMDTCESGEVDEDTVLVAAAGGGSRGMVSRSINRGIEVVKKTSDRPKRNYLNDTNRYIYNNLSRRSGAIVFSSCRGGELSYEDDKYANGFFTEKIISTLTGAGDQINVGDLKKSVSDGVRDISLGLQNPTVDRDNIYVNFSFPKVSGN